MPQYFKMRARDTACGSLTYVTWVVEGAPDTTGAQAGVLPCGVDENDLADIQIISSWIEGSSPEKIGDVLENNLASWNADGNLIDSQLTANPLFDEEDPPNFIGVELFGVTFMEVGQANFLAPPAVIANGGSYTQYSDEDSDASWKRWVCGVYGGGNGVFQIAPFDNGVTGPSYDSGIRLIRYTTAFDAEGQPLQSIQFETQGSYVEAAASNQRYESADAVTPLTFAAFSLMIDQNGNDLALSEGFTYVFTCVLDLTVTGGLKALATLTVVAWRNTGGTTEWATPTLVELAGAGTSRSWAPAVFTVSESSSALMLAIELDLTGDALATECLVSVGHMRTIEPTEYT